MTATQISQNAAINTRNIENQTQPESRLERAKKLSKEAGSISDDAVQSKKEYRPGSLAEKANMVSAYNEAHRKK